MSKAKYTLKQGLSFEEQINLLIKRNLIVNDREKSIKILSRVSYYKLSGYSLHLRNNDIFLDGTTFENIYRLYLFDKKLSALLFDLFETVEISLKTQLANHLGIKYGSLSFLDKNIFRKETMHYDFIHNVYIKEKNKSYGKIKFVTHNIDKYGELPIWVACEIISFGSVSKLYRNLKKGDKKTIIKGFRDDNFIINTDCASNWFQSIVNQRNRIAHHGRLYNRNITSQIKFLNTHDKFFKTLGIQIENDTLFALIFVTKILIGNEPQWIRVLYSMKILFEEYKDVVELKKIGFPTEWEQLLNI